MNEQVARAIEALRQDDDAMGTNNAPFVQEMAEKAYAAEAALAVADARLAAVREIRGCLGAGPMDYDLFIDELDEILAGTSPRIRAES